MEEKKRGRGRPKGSVKPKQPTLPKVRKPRGGVRENAGRKPRMEEQLLIAKLDNIMTQDSAILALQKLIRQGDFRALQLYFNYRWGKPKEQIDVTSGGKAFSMPIVSFFKTDNIEEEEDEFEEQ